MYRSTGDIHDSAESYRQIAISQFDKLGASAPECFNDVDMLTVGMYGKGGNEMISAGGCSDLEYQTHFALWCMMNSPLMIGCDIRNMSDATKETLMNPDLIAINQDPECRSPYVIEPFGNREDLPWDAPEVFVMVRPLSTGELAIAFANFSDRDFPMNLELWDAGIPTGQKVRFYDCISHEETGVYTEHFTAMTKAHGCRIFRAKLI